MSAYADNLKRAVRDVNAWPFGDQRAMSKLTPADLRQSADDMDSGPDTPKARRLLAHAMDLRGLRAATPAELIELWKAIRP